jgi:hypothetical protein
MVGVQVRSLSCAFAQLGRPVRAWHPDIVSELACVHQSIFEHAEIDCRTEQSVRCVGAEVPFNVWSVHAAHLSGDLDCRPLVQASHAGARGFEPVFRASIWLRENGLSGGFSFPPDDDEEFRGGRGKRNGSCFGSSEPPEFAIAPIPTRGNPIASSMQVYQYICRNGRRFSLQIMRLLISGSQVRALVRPPPSLPKPATDSSLAGEAAFAAISRASWSPISGPCLETSPSSAFFARPSPAAKIPFQTHERARAGPRAQEHFRPGARLCQGHARLLRRMP